MALDKKAHDYIQANFNESQFISYYFHLGAATVDVAASKFRSKNFNVICQRKIQAVLAVLQEGYDILFTDVDVLILQDPLSQLLWQGVDYAHSLNTACDHTIDYNYFTNQEGYKVEGNTGFYFIRSNSATISLWQDFLASMKFDAQDDQILFWEFLKVKGQKSPQSLQPIGACHHLANNHSNSLTKTTATTTSTFTMCALDVCLFASTVLNSPTNYQNYLKVLIEQRKQLPLSIHANGILGSLDKVQRMKATGFWLLKEEGAEEENMKSFQCKDFVPNYEQILAKPPQSLASASALAQQPHHPPTHQQPQAGRQQHNLHNHPPQHNNQ